MGRNGYFRLNSAPEHLEGGASAFWRQGNDNSGGQCGAAKGRCGQSARCKKPQQDSPLCAGRGPANRGCQDALSQIRRRGNEFSLAQSAGALLKYVQRPATLWAIP